MSQHDAAALHALQEARVHARLARQRHAARARHLLDPCEPSTQCCNKLLEELISLANDESEAFTDVS